MLALEIEFLTTVYRASLPDGTDAEWPPHPERVFSALVQAWADGGCNPAEQQALLWLEQQEPPIIEADPSNQVSIRDSPTVYVPPNDPPGTYSGRFPERRRQARTFRAVAPSIPVVRLFWLAKSPPANRCCLGEMASRLSCLGHSTSLIRACVRDDMEPDERRAWCPDAAGETTLRIPHPGRLDRLCAWRGAGQRPQSGATHRYSPPGSLREREPPKSWFGGPGDWFVFEDNDGPFRPDILGFPHVAHRVRQALMKLGSQPAPTVISGHDADGAPTSTPHLAVVPLQNVGWPYADGALLGFALVLPRDLAPADRRLALQAIAAFARIDHDEPRSVVQLTTQHGWEVVRAASPARASLKPGRWCASACTWASATPVLLDRFPERDDSTSEATIIATACRNVGLPEPDRIEIAKHSALKGAETAYPARGRPSRPDWSFPKGSKLVLRLRRHVVLRFAAPVTGPVILGAGRFAGFGLCLPLNSAG